MILVIACLFSLFMNTLSDNKYLRLPDIVFECSIRHFGVAITCIIWKWKYRCDHLMIPNPTLSIHVKPLFNSWNLFTLVWVLHQPFEHPETKYPGFISYPARKLVLHPYGYMPLYIIACFSLYNNLNDRDQFQLLWFFPCLVLHKTYEQYSFGLLNYILSKNHAVRDFSRISNNHPYASYPLHNVYFEPKYKINVTPSICVLPLAR